MTAVVMTFRNDAEGFRLRNLLTVLQWHVQTHEYLIIVVEQDKSSQLFEVDLPARVHPVFAWNPNAFNKSWGMNIGATWAKADRLLFADTDNLLQHPLHQAVALCGKDYPFVKPYRISVDLNQVQSDALTSENNDKGNGNSSASLESLAQLDLSHQRGQQGEAYALCSGTFVMHRSLFDSIGGWDERFIGWGGEDDALSFKLQRRRTPSLELPDNCMFHLWHPKAERDTPAYQGNRSLWDRYQHYTDAQLSWVSELQRQGNANMNRHR